MAGYSCGSAARPNVPMYPSLSQPPSQHPSQAYPLGQAYPPPAYGEAYPPHSMPPNPPKYPDMPPAKPGAGKKHSNRNKNRGKGGKRTFSIISMATGLAIDATQGDRLQVWEVNGGEAQKFYEDDDGRIHSALNDWVLESQRGWPLGPGPGSQILLKPSKHIKQQDWIMWKDAVANKNNMNDVLEVAADACKGSPVLWKHSDKSRKQKWRFQY